MWRTLDEQVWLVTAYNDTEPGETYLFDRRTHRLTLQYSVRERLPREAMAKMEAVGYKSADGLEIPAYLRFPNGVPAKVCLPITPTALKSLMFNGLDC